MNKEAAKKMSLAVSKLVIKDPFFASIALRLKRIPATPEMEIPAMGTDSRTLYYNEKWVLDNPTNIVSGVICHEVLHVALQHNFRRKGRDFERWNHACDYAINGHLRENRAIKHCLPTTALYDAKYSGWSSEQIYKDLKDKKSKAPDEANIGIVMDYQHDPNDPNSKPISQQKQEIKLTASQALKASKMQGKESLTLERYISDDTRTILPWQEILNRFVSEHTKNDYTWKKPNKRYVASKIYLPALESPTLGTIACIIDTSGSVSQKEINLFASELKAIFVSYPETKIEVLYVDHGLAGHQTVTASDLKLQAKGGGGTSFVPGFEYLEKEQVEPACTIYFTDGYCDRFPKTPEHPVLWCIISNGIRQFNPPFGEVIKMEIDNYDES